MKISHTYDSSYVYLSILDVLYTNNILDIKGIAHKFEYDISTIYKLVKKIDYNLATINPTIMLVKVCPGKYKFDYIAN